MTDVESQHDRVLVVATPLEPELAERLDAHPQLSVRYEPDLLPPPRYPCDHRGDPDFRRSATQEQRWRDLLATAEVLFGFPGDSPEGLAAVVRGGSPRLVLAQGTAAGAGEQVELAGLTATELERVAVTTASGVHGGPLAEFAILGILSFRRDLRRLETDRRERRWAHYATPDLAGRTIVVAGTGAIGSQVARLAHVLGMKTIGVNRSGRCPESSYDEVHTADRLAAVVAGADALVVTVPLTPATRSLVDAGVLGALAEGAVVVNVGRGAVIDEPALIAALRSGHLSGAALDVTTVEPLPSDSPLWTLPNVLLSPHTAALSPRENERIVDLLLDNVDRLLGGRPLRNRVTATRPY